MKNKEEIKWCLKYYYLNKKEEDEGSGQEWFDVAEGMPDCVTEPKTKAKFQCVTESFHKHQFPDFNH